jgi:hypothetical protein
MKAWSARRAALATASTAAAEYNNWEVDGGDMMDNGATG